MNALWSHGSLQDFLSVVAADRSLPGPSKELFRVIVKAVRQSTGEAHLTDASAMSAMGRQDRKTIYRARRPLIKADYIAFTSGRFGAASVYRLAREPLWVAERIQEKRQADQERRKRDREETDARYGALRAKRIEKAKASAVAPMRQDAMGHQWGTSAPPLTFTDSVVEREVMGEETREETSLPPAPPSIEIRSQATRRRLQAARSGGAAKPAIDHDDQLLVRNWFEERAAVLEFDAGLPRRLAEHRARADTLAKFGSLQPMEVD